MRSFYNIYYFNIECINKYYAPLKHAKYNKCAYNSNKINFKNLILCGLYGVF